MYYLEAIKMDVKTKNSLDIGCGDRMRIADGCMGYGVDLHVMGTNVFNLDCFVENLPIEDNAIDYVFAYDFLEHVPTVVYYSDKLFNCRVHLMNEVWRVMKDGAVFESNTPYFNPDNVRQEWCQDPTHTIPWSKVTFNYFSDLGGEWDRLRSIYGIKARFKIVEMRDNGSHLFVKLQKNE